MQVEQHHLTFSLLTKYAYFFSICTSSLKLFCFFFLFILETFRTLLECHINPLEDNNRRGKLWHRQDKLWVSIYQASDIRYTELAGQWKFRPES